MRPHNRRLALTAVSVAMVVCCALPALASATPEWRIGGAPVSGTRAIEWSKASTAFRWAIVNYPIAGEVEIQCEGTVGSGAVAPKGQGEIGKWTLSKCSGTHCESEPVVEAKDLPWRTQLATVEGAIRNKFESDGHGEPYLKFTCKSILFGSGLGDETSSGALSGGQLVVNHAGIGASAEFKSNEEIKKCVTGTACYFGGGEYLQVPSGSELSVK